MDYGWRDAGWGSGWVAMALMMLAFWGVVAVLAVYVIRSLGRGPRDGDQGAPDQAQRILDERLARGEIDADEYTRRRELLRSR